ncbi:hypothetical protein [Paraliomyxa miuraensis]|uniref:hypothetical protein n=1 Tax=Paraliomyxa miuraensis TaxID=376150 RepID=UPI00224D692F|nr:hypothetical protein [Paraliomyxa miuraensis]MCX4243492.1 hypothetical protein [Paraliomyxa miuraensis]
MTQPHRAAGLFGLLTLVLLVGCDSGSAPPKSAAAKTDAIDAKKVEPAKTETKVEAKAPTPVPEPAPTTAVEPVPTPPEPVPPAVVVDPAAVGDPPPVEPAAADAGAAVDDVAADAADDGADSSDAPEPPSAVAAGDGSSPISLGPDAELLRLVLAHDVVNRQPVDPATTFPAGQKVSLFIEARNETGEDIGIQVTWEDVKSGRRSPPVGVVISPRKLHRTRSYRTMKKPGEYRCIVLGDDDRELAVLPFTIE